MERDNPEQFLKVLGQARLACRRMAENLTRARELAAVPSPGGRRLSAFLAEAPALLRAAQDADRAEEDLRARLPQLPQALSRFEATALRPIKAAIRDVPLPPGGTVFKSVTGVTDAHFADLRGFHGGRHGVLYVRASVDMPRAGRGRLRYGADGPVKVWVNGRFADCAPGATNPAVPEAYRCPVRWRKGANTILMALCTNHGMAWGVYATAAWE